MRGSAAAVGSIWWGADLLETYGMKPGDGGVLRPFEDRLLVASITARCGIACAIGLLICQSLHVVGLALIGADFDVHTKVGFLDIIGTYKISEVASGHVDRNDQAQCS